MIPSTQPPTFDCADMHKVNGSWPILQPNADISGVGVLVSFIVTAYITLLIVIAQYVLNDISSQSVNPIDRLVIGCLWRNSTGSKLSKRWHRKLQDIVLLFSDQQLVTGIAILAGGFTQLSNDISSYHWSIIISLAWFSSLTHLTTITVLRDHLLANPAIRTWRVLCMLGLISLLIAAIVPASALQWLPIYQDQVLSSWLVDDAGNVHRSKQIIYNPNHIDEFTDVRPENVSTILAIPAKCYYMGSKILEANTIGYVADCSIELRSQCIFGWNQENAYGGFISIGLLTTSYFSRMLRLFAASSAATHKLIRKKPGDLLKVIINHAHRQSIKTFRPPFVRHMWICTYMCLLTSLLMGRALFDMWGSIIGEILWLLYALVYGTLRLYWARAQSTNSIQQDENLWTWGQWVPILMLALPFLSLFEALYPESPHHQQHTDLGAIVVDTIPIRLSIRTSISSSSTTLVHPSNRMKPEALAPIYTATKGKSHKEDKSLQSPHYAILNLATNSTTSTLAPDPSPRSPKPPASPLTLPLTHERNYYQYTWFHGLLWLMVLISVTVLFSFIRSVFNRQARETLKTLVYNIGGMCIPTCGVYTIVCLSFQEYHPGGWGRKWGFLGWLLFCLAAYVTWDIFTVGLEVFTYRS